MAEVLSTTQLGSPVPVPRQPPHSEDAEQSLLGGIMLEERAWDQIADVVNGKDFYRPDHRLIFAAMGDLMERNQPLDAITVGDHLQRQDKLDDAGGRAYLARLVGNTPGAANIRRYASIVREHAMLRQLIEVGGDIAASAFESEGRQVEELVDLAEQRVFDIAERGQRSGSGFVPVKEIVPNNIDRLDALRDSEDGITGVKTGFDDLDSRTAGFQAGDLIVIAGRPSMGKTALALNIATFASVDEKQRIPSGIFSLEMPKEQVTMRMISAIGQVDQSRLRSGRLTDEDWQGVNHASAMMSNAPIYIDDAPGLSPTELRARARRLKREHGLGFIVVDYLQLMQISGSTENRATEISEISRSLKGLARELNIPVVALSQLNRSVEQRNDKRPVMSDLRESGAIEQDADVIIFIYRDELYNDETHKKGVADIIIGKQRNGPIGDFPLTFQGEFTRFVNFVSDAYGEGVYG